MSYITRRRRGRLALSGVQSQPPGAAVSTLAIGDITEYGHIGPHSVNIAPRWYRAMQGCSLAGDDAPTASSLETPTLSDPFQAHVAGRLDDLRELERQRNADDRMRGYLQLAATLSIPLAAWVWRRLLKRQG